MKRKNRCRFFFLLVVVALLLACPAYAAFQSDYEAINQAAKSVMLLEVYDENDQLLATGSGFVAFNKRMIVTNYHVMENADHIVAHSDENYSYHIDKVYIADKMRDIAILGFVSPTDLVPLTLAPDAPLLRGEPIVVVSSPKGLKNAVTMGNISTFGQDDGIEVIQFTAPISPGSSGGALFNDDGAIIGVVFATYKGSDAQNINFAIKASEVVALYEQVDEKLAVPLRDYEQSSANPDPAETPDPEADHATEPDPNDRLEATATGNKVALTWPAQAGVSEYFVGYDIESNHYFTTLSTDGPYAVIENLVPNMTYRFYLATSEEALKKRINSGDCDATVKLDPGEDFAFRNYAVDRLDIISCPVGENVYGAEAQWRYYDALTDELVRGAGVTLDYHAILHYDMDAGEAMEDAPVLKVLITPDDQVFTQTAKFDFGSGAEQDARGSYSLNTLFNKYSQQVDQWAEGEYMFALFCDGKFAGGRSFDVGAQAEGTPAGNPEIPNAQMAGDDEVVLTMDGKTMTLPMSGNFVMSNVSDYLHVFYMAGDWAFELNIPITATIGSQYDETWGVRSDGWLYGIAVRDYRLSGVVAYEAGNNISSPYGASPSGSSYTLKIDEISNLGRKYRGSFGGVLVNDDGKKLPVSGNFMFTLMDEPYQDIKNGGKVSPTPSPNIVSRLYPALVRGDTGEAVRRLQKRLIELGYLNDVADGSFGEKTERAIKAFQKATGVSQDGIAGSSLQSKLFGSSAKRFVEPSVALILQSPCNGQWKKASDNRLKFRCDVTNISSTRTVKAYKLYLYPLDSDGDYIIGEDQVYVSNETKRVKPGETVTSDYFVIPDRSRICEVYAKVAQVVYTDGTTATNTEDNYLSWTITW